MNAILHLLLAAALLLAQVFPGSSPAGTASREECATDCCAMEDEEPEACGCAAVPGSEPAPQPAVVPPASGRGLVPQIAWTGGVEKIPAQVFEDDEAVRSARPAPDARIAAAPHVRLAVLFCSFLT